MTRYGSLPFREQAEFFRQKAPVPTRAWTDLWESEHDHAFMVAGAMKADLLTDFQTSIQKAIDEGTTLETFRRDFDEIVARHGWAYQGGRNWRTRVIYETNLRQSYHAGREAQMADPDLRALRPYGLYRHGGSEDPREEHLALDGTVLPLDDPWWDTWSPQNGWGCKCKKFMVSKEEAERLGYQVREKSPPIEWEEKTVGARGPTPRTVRVPKGIDPGFAYRPGASTAQAASAFVEKSVRLDPAIGISAVNRAVASPSFTRFYDAPQGNYPVAILRPGDAQAMGAKTLTVGLSADTVRKQRREHPDVSAADYVLVQRVVTEGERIPDGRRSSVYVLETASFIAVVKATETGHGLFLTSFRRLSSDQGKRDREIARLRSKQRR